MFSRWLCAWAVLKQDRQSILVLYHYYGVTTLYFIPCWYYIILTAVCIFHVFYLLANFKTLVHILLWTFIHLYLISTTGILQSAFHFGFLSSLPISSALQLAAGRAAKTAIPKDFYIKLPGSHHGGHQHITALALFQGIFTSWGVYILQLNVKFTWWDFEAWFRSFQELKQLTV